MNKRPPPVRWNEYPWHPAAELLPMSSPDTINEVGGDIEANGLQHPLIAFEDNTEEANGASGPFPRYKLDGRTREAAMKQRGMDPELVGLKGAITASGAVRLVKAMTRASDGVSWEVSIDPFRLVESLNVHRRHLTVEQKRQVTAELIKAMPNASDREIARKVGVSHPTVADVRKEEDDRNGKVFQIDRSPLDRVKAVLRQDPSLSDMAAAKAAEVAKSTAHKARHELIEAGEITARENPRAPSKPRAKVDPKPEKPKLTDEEKAAARKAAKITDDISAVAVAVEQLVKDIKTVVKHPLNDEQIEALRLRRTEALEALRTLP